MTVCGHHRLKEALDQALILRGSRDFATRAGYEAFVKRLLEQRNKARGKRVAEELRALQPLPKLWLDAVTEDWVRVSRFSTLCYKNNLYTVNSRLTREWVKVRCHVDHLEIWYGGRKVDTLERQRGRGGARIECQYTGDAFGVRVHGNDFIHAAADALSGGLFSKALPRYTHAIPVSTWGVIFVVQALLAAPLD